MGRKATSEYNLAVIHPKVAKEWHPTKNKPLTPKDVTHGSHIKVWWKCKNAHEWEASVNKRSIGRGCPECYLIQIGNIVTKAALKKSGNLKDNFPEIAKEWHPTKNKLLTPKDVPPGSHKKVWWKCKKGHEWFTEIRSRTKRKTRCPKCWKKIRSNVLKKAALKKSGNLKDKFPKIAKEWHPTKNKDLKPKNVTPMSHVKVWWKCENAHEWEATIASRTYQGSGCPECLGRKAGRHNNLKKQFPKIAKEWHPTKNNNLFPENFVPGSNVKIWWKCKKGHIWEAEIYSRTGLDSGCPKCYKKNKGTIRTNAALKKSGNIKDKFPEIAEEWHPTKNKSLTPKDVPPGSGKKVWWKCKKGHEWETEVTTRTIQGSGCPNCKPNISKFQIQIYCELKTIFKEIQFNKKVHKIECDVYLPKYRIAIEYDGYHWHKVIKKDKKKNIGLAEHGIILFRIRDKGLKKVSCRDIVTLKNEKPIELIKRLLKSMITYYPFQKPQENKIEKYFQRTTLSNIQEYNDLISHLPGALPKDSLEKNYPKLLKEWNYKKNHPLSPSWCYSKSNIKVWWKCKRGHEWESVIQSRTAQGSGCPECKGKRVGKENNLKYKFPEIAEEWHPTKNKPLIPENVTSRSGRKVWWKCKRGHEWETKIAPRTGSINRKGTGCPNCYKEGIKKKK